jgi:hypothetical protein
MGVRNAVLWLNAEGVTLAQVIASKYCVNISYKDRLKQS